MSNSTFTNFVPSSSGLCREYLTLTMEEFYDDIYAVLGYYAAYSVNFLPTFRDDLSFAYSRVKKSFFDFLTFEGGITGDFPL